jgi:hypothetical protein
MAVVEIDSERDTRDWIKVQIKPDTYARLRAWIDAVYPDSRLRPPMREAAELDDAEQQVPPEPTPLDRLAALRNRS